MDLGTITISIWIISFALECGLAVFLWARDEARYGKVAAYVGFCIARDIFQICLLWFYTPYFYGYWILQGMSIFLRALIMAEAGKAWKWRLWEIPKADPWRQILLGLTIEAGGELATYGAKLALHLKRNPTLVHIRGAFFVLMLVLWLDAMAGKRK